MTPQPKIIFRVGDMVRIKTGPFASFTGRIEGINQARQLLKIVVKLFGRATALKMNFGEVEKIEFAPPDIPESGVN